MDLVASCKEKLAYFPIKELKDVLTQSGLSKQGRKQDLVDRILASLTDEQGSKISTKKSNLGKDQVAKLVDDTYRKMQVSGATDLASKGPGVSDSSKVKIKGETEDPFLPEVKVRCLCGIALETDSMIKCEDRRCQVWQHIGCVIIPDKPTEGNSSFPDLFYCEICRLNRADPFWVSMGHPLHPVKLVTTNIPADGTNPVQSVEKTFQLTRADKDLLSRQEYDVQAWCMLLNDKVSFRMQWPLFADLQVNGMTIRAINRPGPQLLGANGRDDGPIITPYTKDGINKIFLSGRDARVFCLGVRIVKRRTVKQILGMIPKESDGECLEDALARVRRCIGGGATTDNADSDSDVEVVADFFGVNLRCPRNSHHSEQRWRDRTMPEGLSTVTPDSVTNGLNELSIREHGQSNALVSIIESGSAQRAQASGDGNKLIWQPRSYGTTSGALTVEVVKDPCKEAAAEIPWNGFRTKSPSRSGSGLSNLFKGNLLDNFDVDNSTFVQAKIRATFYPKFENEKSDQETRTRMMEMVAKGLATLEVSLKHSGSLFMFASDKGGAYAKNSFGNIYTAVGVFVLGRMFLEAWGTEAVKKQAEFNSFLENNHVYFNGIGNCCSWRPRPTPSRRLRKSVSSFFAAYDALCEEGTTTSVCKALDEVADISVPGSKDHVEVQGEILEGLVARIVSRDSSNHIEEILKKFPPPLVERDGFDLGPSLREICAANRSDKKQQIKVLLQNVGSSFCPDYSDWFRNEAGDTHSRTADNKSVLSKVLQANPADFSTVKLLEIIRLIKEKRFLVAFKCYHNYHQDDSTASDNLFYKMVLHVHSDSGFRRYQKEMRYKSDLWPLYRGFFVDINLFKAKKENAPEIRKNNVSMDNESNDVLGKEEFADEDANLMIKLKFLTYKLRTFLIRNGLSILFKESQAAYKAYYLRQMKLWGTSSAKQRELGKMLDEWAVYIRKKCGNKLLSSATYLSEAEPFLEQYAKRSLQNQILIGSAGNMVRTEDFLAILEEEKDEEGDLKIEKDVAPSSPSVMDIVPKSQGLLVFFPGIPGCAKSALCKELLNVPRGLGDDRPLHSLMGDLIKGKYWQKVADERRKKPYSIMLADKNAPNKEVWRQIEDMCCSTKGTAVPVVPDSEGTDSNPFSIDALAVFMMRVLQRVNHPGNLDQASPNAGYVLVMFYHLYDGKSGREFESELIERFGSLIKMPLLKSERSPLPDAVKSVLEEGISLYNLHTNRHGRLDSSKGTYAKEWAKWEKQVRETLNRNSEYLKSIQVPFETAVHDVLEQLRRIAKEVWKYCFCCCQSACFRYSKPACQPHGNSKIEAFLKDKNLENKLKRRHVTLAHKRGHGIKAVADYGVFVNQEVPVKLTALLFSNKMAAFEVELGSIEGERIVSKNSWPHVTIWTEDGVGAKEASLLPQLISEGKATLVEITPPTTIVGKVQFY